VFLSDAMSAQDRAALLVQIAVTVNHRVMLFRRKQATGARWLA
jgi:hypothetical protein